MHSFSRATLAAPQNTHIHTHIHTFTHPRAPTQGNKGGVGVRLRVHDTTICFINSHLAAFTEMVERRNMDFAEIVRRLDFAPTHDRWQTRRGGGPNDRQRIPDNEYACVSIGVRFLLIRVSSPIDSFY